MPELTLADLASAYAAGDEAPAPTDAFGNPIAQIPSEWTPAHVLNRIVAAYDVVQRVTRSPGPKAFGTSWPGILVEWADLVDEDKRERIQARAEEEVAKAGARVRGPINMERFVDKATIDQMSADREVELRRRGNRPSALMIEMADEAVFWPLRFLRDADVHADAVRTWALSVAEGFDLERALSRRRRVADEMIRIMRGAPEPAAVVDEERLKVIARSVATAANVQLAEAREKARAARADRQLAAARADAEYARRRARERFADVLNREQLIARPPTVKIDRSEVMPGKVFWRQTLDKKRWEAAAFIVDGLRAAGVPVR